MRRFRVIVGKITAHAKQIYNDVGLSHQRLFLAALVWLVKINMFVIHFILGNFGMHNDLQLKSWYHFPVPCYIGIFLEVLCITSFCFCVRGHFIMVCVSVPWVTVNILIPWFSKVFATEACSNCCKDRHFKPSPFPLDYPKVTVLVQHQPKHNPTPNKSSLLYHTLGNYRQYAGGSHKQRDEGGETPALEFKNTLPL